MNSSTPGCSTCATDPRDWYLVEEILVKGWGARHPALSDSGEVRHLIGPYTMTEAHVFGKVMGLPNVIHLPERRRDRMNMKKLFVIEMEQRFGPHPVPYIWTVTESEEFHGHEVTGESEVLMSTMDDMGDVTMIVVAADLEEAKSIALKSQE